MSQNQLFGKGSSPSLRSLRRPKFLKPGERSGNGSMYKAGEAGRLGIVAPANVEQNTPDEKHGSLQNGHNPNILYTGSIFLDEQADVSVECTIQGFNRQGAMLGLESTAEIPGEFSLAFDSHPDQKMPCRVAWRSPKNLRVRFVT